jgi:transcriptional regulator with XRE-family HTH domain
MRPSNTRLRLHWASLLRQARHDAGLSQRQLRERLNADGGTVVAPEVISRWENAVYSPSDENRARLAHALGKTVPELFPYYFDDEPNGSNEAAA